MTVIHTLLAALMLAASAEAYAADIGVSVSIGDPNFYGRIDIGSFPQPRVIYPEPIVIVPGGPREPLYLRVPPGHAKDWGKHCKQYGACGRPVYFVDDDWYRREYAPAYREKHARGKPGQGDEGHGKNHEKGHGKARGKE